MTISVPSGAHLPSTMAGIAARLAQIVIGLLFEAAVLFGAAGRLDWTWAWAFLAILFVSIVINSAFLLRTSPETIAERGRGLGATRDWDKLVSTLYSLAQFLLIPLVAGLDVRLVWTAELGTGAHVAGAAVLAAGLVIFGWAMIENAYFSTAVRIQSDRGQTVCRTGPYRFVRHPGYVGTILQSLGIPILLGSLWALVPGVAAIVLIVARTALEDRTLQAELPGYGDFARDVRYRLLPGVW